MIVVKCAAAAIGAAVAAFIPAVILNVVLYSVGVPFEVLGLAWSAGTCAVARYIAREYLDSERVWLWTAGGLLIGLAILPALVFAYVWDQTNQDKQYRTLPPNVVGHASLESPHYLTSARA